MLKSHEIFHSSNGKRQILIAEDEFINRELLGEMLKEEYDLLYAEDGLKTMEMMRQYKDTLSLVLLDILMPGMNGLEVLKKVWEDDSLSRIPIIVTTAERETEVESLKLGAIDFIPKPYPDANVIRARVLRTIELSEDRDIIQSTERDELTGLYNREYFIRYAEQFDQFHKEKKMDAIIVDINHFRMINERYGKAYGDKILKKIARQLKELVGDSEGIVCRRSADMFMIYCSHREDYQEFLKKASVRLSEEDSSAGQVHLRMGVYSDVDKTIDIERRFDRAKMAADTVRGSFVRNVGMYDMDLHKRQLYAEQLIEDFPAAIEKKQFQVYYQPKFDIRPDIPVLSSAEALVRWIHPDLGMVSPGIFIPLFEENGLIQRLDQYVWRETARQIQDWKKRMGYYVPVSVNVSRIDMFDTELPDTFRQILEDYQLDGTDLLLEVTESAYTENSGQIVDMVNRLRDMGFQIEMDDFGTGYSSLNMISNLPIDALKLDMQFIRNAFRDGGNTHMLEVIIGIADFLNVPVIAEGVETQEQLRSLKTLGCDIVQGYFFSQAVPAAAFEPFILQKKEADTAKAAAEEEEAGRLNAEEKILQVKMNRLQDEIEKNSSRKAEAAASAEEKTKRTGIRLRTASILSLILALAAAIALLVADMSVTRSYNQMEEAREHYVSAQQAVSDMETASDYLTDQVRCFVVTGEPAYMESFFEELEVTRHRETAVTNLAALMENSDSVVLEDLNTALSLSNELVEYEKQAMKLMTQARAYDPDRIPEAVAQVVLTPEELAMTPEEQEEKARMLVFDSNYMLYKEKIRENVSLCTQALLKNSGQEVEHTTSRLSLLVRVQTVLTIVFLLIVLGVVLIITLLVRRPLTRMVQLMQKQEPIQPAGVEELRFVTRIYNRILQENREAKERLSHEASHDALTGLFNRGAYDLLMESADTEHMALLLIDVDHFKEVNDTYGHAVGDRILKRVADILRHSFRSVDIICRTGGDEFAVVMTRVDSSLRQLVVNKIEQANNLLQHPKDDLPAVSLSVGVAFSDRKNPRGDIYQDADSALYKVKAAGKNGCAIYE